MKKRSQDGAVLKIVLDENAPCYDDGGMLLSVRIINWCFAALLIVGGVIGYMKGSYTSIYVSLVFAIGYCFVKTKRSAIILSAALALLFLYRLLLTGKMMPAIPLLVLSCGMLLLHIFSRSPPNSGSS